MNLGVLENILETCKDNIVISDMFTKANQVINNSGYKNIVCSVSGGADSDIMLDVIEKIRKPEVKVTYVWFDTGLEYQATKEHLTYLENRYNIKVQRERAIKPIPLAVKEYGQPFLSKFVSYILWKMQKSGFKFEDKSYDELIKEYPHNKTDIKWWCNMHDPVHMHDYGFSRFNISYYRYLKEFLIENPPQFKISNLCCDWAKKKVSKKMIEETNCDLMIIGVRKDEGGVRSAAYKNCYSVNENGTSQYRPLFWVSAKDKDYYVRKYNIVHSDCYTKYGFNRTGCCGCPYGGRNLEFELVKTELYEPKLYKAVETVFKDSYEYTKQYRAYVQKKKWEEKHKRIKRLF